MCGGEEGCFGVVWRFIRYEVLVFATHKLAGVEIGHRFRGHWFGSLRAGYSGVDGALAGGL